MDLADTAVQEAYHDITNNEPTDWYLFILPLSVCLEADLTTRLLLNYDLVSPTMIESLNG
jgi:hypothetical protein